MKGGLAPLLLFKVNTLYLVMPVRHHRIKHSY